jgi:hypothetical protein
MNYLKCKCRLINLFVLALACALFSGCAPTSRTSKYMIAAPSALTGPPAGKALVCIHRPKAFSGHPLYTKIWDGTNFIADLGNGHSVAYVCDPGTHYFMNTSAEAEGCVQAQLLPDKTYDLWTDTILSTFIVSFKIKPVHQDAEGRQKVAEWTKETRWVEPGLRAAAFDQNEKLQKDIRQLIEDFASGKRHDKLQYLAPDDHR